MKGLILFILTFLVTIPATYAQEDSTKQKAEPVRPPFESSFLIDNQTVEVPSLHTLEFVMQHRFGRMDNGFTDIWGVWGASNIRLGWSYTFTNNFQAGIGMTKFDRLFDLTLKYRLLQQTVTNSIPVGVTFFGDYAIDSRDEESFGNDYKFSNRMSYFSQLIICRKINYRLSVQVAPSFTHYNMTDTLFEHDKIGISFSGRARLTSTMNLIVNYDWPLPIKGIREFSDESNDPLGNFGVGIELSTSTHAFQVFVGNATGLLAQKNMVYNRNRFLVIGFNITRLWNF